MSARVLPVLVAALVFLATVWTITPWPVGAIQDDASYVILAKSLAAGEGYRQLNLPGAPRVAHYPPGYPLFLAGLWRAWPQFPQNVILFKYANAVLLAIAALGMYALARSRAAGSLPPSIAAAAALAGMGCVLVLFVGGMVLSEPLFLALLFPALLLADRSVQSGRLRDAALAGLVAGMLALVRSIGVVLLPALVAMLLWRRQRSAALAALLAGAVVLLPWQVWATLHAPELPAVVSGKYGGYLVWLADAYREQGLQFGVDVVRRNARDLWSVLDPIVLPQSVQQAWARTAALIGAAALALAGLARMTRGGSVTGFFVLGYVAIMLLWPFDVVRFLMALWPLLALGCAAAAAAAWQARELSAVWIIPRTAALANAAALLAGFLVYNARGYREQWWAGPQRETGERLAPVLDWVRENSDSADVLSVEDDPAVYLYTGRRTVPASRSRATDHLQPQPIGSDIATVREILERYQPRFHIVSAAPALRAADSLARTRPEVLRPVDRAARATVYLTTIR